MAKAQPALRHLRLRRASAKTRFPVRATIRTCGTSVAASPIVQARRAAAAQAGRSRREGTQSTLISAINVYDSTHVPQHRRRARVKKVRITEGFSSEEGFPNMFGLTEFDGQARLGEVDVQPDGSFKARGPGQHAGPHPAHRQVRHGDRDQRARRRQRVRAGVDPGPRGRGARVRRLPRGSHQDHRSSLPARRRCRRSARRRSTTPGQTRQQRLSTTTPRTRSMGVPWDKALQPIFDAHCVDCHDGTNGARQPELHDHRRDRHDDVQLHLRPDQQAGRASTRAR